nr:hypothetical protein [Actinomycetota bacterium]
AALYAAVALVAAGCGSDHAAPAQPLPAAGPPNVVRVALANFRWPLDPALAEGRDETTLARALYATPLRTDPVSGAVVPGLCTAWKASPDFRRWTFSCRSAPSIAAALRRVVRLGRAPARWLFVGALRIAAPSASSLIVQLEEPWRRFPYALTAVAAAPRFVSGTFRLVSGSPRRVVVRRPGLTVVFRRLGTRGAMHEFRRGRLDEAPVPLGDIVAVRRDRRLGATLMARTLLAQDIVFFRGGPAQSVIHAYWQTADRTDYEQLVPELAGSAAFGLVGRGEQQDPARLRDALKRIPSLPRAQVRIGVPPDPVLRYGARLLYAQWRDVGLGPVLVADSARNVTTDFRRLIAAYPQDEALLAEVVYRSSVGSRDLLAAVLASTEQRPALERLDSELRSLARVVPIAWVVDARLVSPRLEGWREDVLGNVDYAAVRSRASSRRP